MVHLISESDSFEDGSRENPAFSIIVEIGFVRKHLAHKGFIVRKGAKYSEWRGVCYTTNYGTICLSINLLILFLYKKRKSGKTCFLGVKYLAFCHIITS